MTTPAPPGLEWAESNPPYSTKKKYLWILTWILQRDTPGVYVHPFDLLLASDRQRIEAESLVFQSTNAIREHFRLGPLPDSGIQSIEEEDCPPVHKLWMDTDEGRINVGTGEAVQRQREGFPVSIFQRSFARLLSYFERVEENSFGTRWTEAATTTADPADPPGDDDSTIAPPSDSARVPICIGRPIIQILAKEGMWTSANGNSVVAASCLFQKDPYQDRADL